LWDAAEPLEISHCADIPSKTKETSSSNALDLHWNSAILVGQILAARAAISYVSHSNSRFTAAAKARRTM
jgi:hypothetical protein